MNGLFRCTLCPHEAQYSTDATVMTCHMCGETMKRASGSIGPAQADQPQAPRHQLGVKTMDIKALSSAERDAILDFLLYTMKQEARHRLMHEFPQQYNRMCGREIMVVEMNDPLSVINTAQYEETE